MNVRAQSLIHAAKWVQEERGDAALREVLRHCSTPVRQRYMSALPIEWHPQWELIEFITAVEELLGDKSGQQTVQIGAATARASLNGFVKKTVFYFANREYLLRRVASLWHQFNDAGDLRVLGFDDRKAQVELVGIPIHNRYFCALITGWSQEVSLALGVKTPVSKHVSCLANAGDRCLWHIAWLGYSFDELDLRRSQKCWESSAVRVEGTRR